MSPALLFAAADRHVLKTENLNAAPAFLVNSDQHGTGMEFRIAGFEADDVQLDGKAYQSIAPITDQPEMFGLTGEEGLPELPVFSQLIGIPDQSGVRVEILSASYEVIENVEIEPSQPPMVEGSTEIPPFTINSEFYQRNEFYPAAPIELGSPIICRDLRMIQVVINPFQYNPVSRQLRVYTDLDYNLIYEGQDSRNVKIRRSNNISESFLPLYRSMVPNADEMLATYQPIRGGYLIITPDAFADSAAVLGRWKHLKGYDVVIARGSDIDPNGSTPTQQEVFDYIQSAYQNWEIPPEYVCIIGDENLDIPDFPYGGYASDHKYTCVDGDDFMADVLVTRMSIDYSLATLSRAMHKALKYEKTPIMSDPAHWQRGLSIAGNVGATTPRITVLWVRHMLMNHGFTQVDTSFRWSSGQSDPNLLGFFNAGPSIISYRGWAGASGWYSPSFNTSDLDLIQNNNKLAPMASIVCGTGSFGYGECFGEKWIRMGSSVNAMKGGPAFYGASDGNTHTKWNNPIMIGYYWGLLEEGIYNFAAAAFRGKIQLYNTYPRFNGDGSYVAQYFHTYNTLGDPELEIRTAIPQTMSVTYPSTIPVGTSMMQIHVTGSDLAPLAGAYVNLVKGYGVSEQVFVGGRTDDNGDILLNFTASTADTMFVTVTARNYIPHLGYSLVQTQSVAVNVSTITLDDDNSGNSSGNSDGNANPSETVEFAIALKNFGNSVTATNVSATLVSDYPELSVTVANQSYGSIAPGGSANSGKYAVHLANSIPHAEYYILRLNITSDQGPWTAALPVDVKSMAFLHLNSHYPGNPNSRLDPGESSAFYVTLQNIGELAGTSVTGLLTTDDPGIIITDGSAPFGNIAIGGNGSNSASPFVIEAADDVYNGHNVNFDLLLTSSNGSAAHRVISIVVGHTSTFDPIGPDDYGYYLYDNTDAGYGPAPFYNWVEISPYAGGSGTRIDFVNTDDASTVLSLPFNFVYYGQSFDYTLVCTNGFVAFDTSTYDMGGDRWYNFHNKQIPDPAAPRGLIGPFWDDLEYSGNAGVFQYYDAVNHRFIIEWKECMHPNPGSPHSPETFQMIIYDTLYYPTPTGDSEILFQYHTVYNDDNDNWDFDRPGLYSTVGMQNLENNDGLQYTFDNLYHPGAAPLSAGRAIKITTAQGIAPPPQMVYDPTSYLVSLQEGQMTTDSLHISNIGQGTLVFTLAEVTDNRIAMTRQVDFADITAAPRPLPIGYDNSLNVKPLDKNSPIYPPSITGRGGPDAFGYVWVDSDEQDGPAYNWVDISGDGTPVSLGDDNSVGPIDMGFSFPFYGNSYSSIFINSNGILTFGAGTGSYSNQPIPTSSAPNDFIAMFWDDLNPSLYGQVYYYNDTANNRFIVSYVGVPLFSGGGTSSLTFEAILYPTGHISIQYNTLDPGTGSLTSNSVGIEDLAGTTGLQVAYNSSYLTDQLALRFYPASFWLMLDIHGGILSSGEDTTAIVTFNASELTEGVYSGHIDLDSNDPTQSSVDIPITLTVGSAGAPDISFTPTSITVDLTEGELTTRNINIHNNGTADLYLNLNAIEFNLRGPSGGLIATALPEENHSGPDDPPVVQNVWLFVSPPSDTIATGDSLVAVVTLNAASISEGEYFGQINLVSNDPDTPTGHVPVTLNVASAGPNCDYVPGDVNGSSSYNGLDVTFSVAYFKGGAPPGYSCECTPGHTWHVSGDVNGSCSFNGLDVTYGVAYFKGGTGPMPCADCPPGGRIVPIQGEKPPID